MRSEYEQLTRGKNVRENLSALRGEVKEEKTRAALSAMPGIAALLTTFLRDGDAKVRKNAALLAGDLGLSSMRQALFDAYAAERTLFVRSAYLTSLGKMDAREYIPFFEKQLEELRNDAIPEDEKKHRGEEIRELTRILAQKEEGGKMAKHAFLGLKAARPILLTASRELRGVTLVEAKELDGKIRLKAELHSLGVLVFTKDAEQLAKLRTYREMLFPLYAQAEPEGGARGKKRPVHIPADASPREAAQLLWSSDLFSLIAECHDGGAPYAFRLDYAGEKPETEYVKKLGGALEAAFGWQLVNAAGDYEMEIRFFSIKGGERVPFVKFFTIPCDRFAYRKNAVAASIHPANAAALVRLAQPYLKRNARILDPCCGVGTMLIERGICVPAREKYGIDTFGDALAFARENAALAGDRIHFIHRDYLDYERDREFDEIISNLPERGKKTKGEQDDFYAAFFEKSAELLAQGGVMVLYSGEEGFVKKQIRLHRDFSLLKEYNVREKDGYYLFIIGFKR